MIACMFAKDRPVPFTELDVRLVCETPGCEAEYFPPAEWVANYPHGLSRMVRETAAARDGWRVDEYGQDRCPSHGTGKPPYSAYPAGHPLAREDAKPDPATVTVPDGFPRIHAVPTDPDADAAAASFNATYDKALADEETARAYREAGAFTLAPHRGSHRAKTPLLVQLGLIARKPIDALRPDPLVLDGDDALDTDDPTEFIAPLQHGGLQAERKMRAEFERRGGWLGLPRKARSRRKRRQKAVAVESAPTVMDLAA